MSNSISKKSENLMQVLHELKHNDTQEAYNLLDKYFANWKAVEWYSKKYDSTKYLLFTVLGDKNE